MKKKQIYEFGRLYYPYGNDQEWVEWFVKVAPLKIQRTLEVLSHYKRRNAKLLDYGCGIGFNIYYYSKVFPNVIGIDNDQKSVEVARRELKKLGINKKILQYDGKILPFPENQFDIVTANDVYEHVKDPRLMLSEIYRVLKPDGILFIHNPNKLWPIETHYKLPLLSYLPRSLANFYLRLTGRAKTYDDIKLPTYGQFKNNLEDYFKTKNISFELIKDYKKNKLVDERGFIIIVVGNFLKSIDRLREVPILSIFYVLVTEFLNWISTGWVFLAWPKK